MQIFPEIYQVASFSPFKAKILSSVTSVTNDLLENYSRFSSLSIPNIPVQRFSAQYNTTQLNTTQLNTT